MTGERQKMSEPSGGNQGPDPDEVHDPNKVHDPNQAHDGVQDRDEGRDQADQTSGSVFNDPTAPVWADPTTPMPTPPPPPVAPPRQAESQAAVPPPVPASNPYAQQPPVQYEQYGQQYSQQTGQPGGQYGQPQPGPYGQPQPGQQYPAYGQQAYATGQQSETNVSAIVLTIVSGIIMLSTCFLIGIPSLIFGIMALTSNNTDPTGSRKKTKTGWILFAVNAGVVILLGVIGSVLLVTYSNNTSSTGFGY